MQQLMSLSLNQDSDAEDGDYNSDNENYADNEVDEEDEEIVEDLDDDDGNNYEGEDEFEWYDWPDQSKLAALDDLPDAIAAAELEDTGEQISLDYLRNPALNSDQDDEEEDVNVVYGGSGGGGIGGDGVGESADNAPGQVPAQGNLFFSTPCSCTFQFDYVIIYFKLRVLILSRLASYFTT